jgi:Fe-S-cluster containining protein
MCCDGTLFDQVLDRDYDSKTGDIIAIRDITLPCSNHINMKCAIYESRPKRCREFKCVALVWYEGNAITKENALKLINGVKNGTIPKERFIAGKYLEEYYE